MGIAKSTDHGLARPILPEMDESPGKVAMDVMEGTLEESQDWVATPETPTTVTVARIAETRTSGMTHESQPTGGPCRFEHFWSPNDF